ncbi:MAG: sporulation initiation factor Spo0A C-terminal domain-containing protein [Dorea sp.]
MIIDRRGISACSSSKQLYPEIARKYKTTVGSVERDIRTVIKESVGKMVTISFSPTRSGHYMSVQRPVNFSTSLSPI